LLIIRDARHGGTWARLKACSNRDCRWAFYDRSHTRRGAWCDMAVCGNLIKVRNLRARRAGRARAAR
jgi:predicted RNA-binding Zn ribbon-like protein